MDKVLQKFQHLQIQLEEITSATNNFNDEKNRIGVGGFGNVYKGEVSHSEGRSMVAIKRLVSTRGQGTPEFLKEITTLSDYKHKNVISLLGFCCEENEMILVYEHASRGSLDRYLNTPHLTWSQRIKICLDAAKGLSYLHDPRGTHRRLIHCDVKSGNILLDDQWNAKVSDLGLSIIGSANEHHSLIVTLAAGTVGYIDPQYQMTHTLTKESDVYSFGVVLFEVLCGRLCCTYSNSRVHQNLVPMWIESYEQKKLNDIIFKDPTIQPMDQGSLKTFSDVAYRCLKESREDRPTMAEVVTELEKALESQDQVLKYQELQIKKQELLIKDQELMREWLEQCSYHENIIKSAESPLSTRSEVELMKLLSKGILLNGGKRWFSLNKKGEHCEMISIVECLGSDVKNDRFWTQYNSNSRFPVGTYPYYQRDGIWKTHVKAQFLSPGITYTVNLLFKCEGAKNNKRCHYRALEYKLEGETESSISHVVYKREDGWWVCELYQFTTDQSTVDLQILFHGFSSYFFPAMQAEGIEFRPLEKVEHKDENQPILDLDPDTNWEENMPADYEDIMKRSENSLQWTTKEEAYSIIRKGFLINDDKKKRGIWFSLDKNGKKCHMLSAALMWQSNIDGKIFLPESRFEEAVQWDNDYILINTKVQSELLTSETTYACYLVYKLPEDQSSFETPMEVKDRQCDSGDRICYIYLTSPPQTPVIRPKAGQSTHNPPSWPKIKSVPQQRNDGWIEVQIWELKAAATTTSMELKLKFPDRNKISGLIIEGIEFRPI